VHQLSGIKNKNDIKQVMTNITTKLPALELHQGLKTNNPIIQLRHARKNLINSRFNSEDLRDNYLDLKQDELIREGKLTQANAIKQQQAKER
jgi:hypothetical protein